MVQKSGFTNNEWQLITDGPNWVFAALAAADGNVALMIKARESKAFEQVVEDYRTRSGFMADVMGDLDKASRQIKGATLSQSVQKLEDIGDLLEKKANADEASEYRRFLASVGDAVAQATGEGALGLGDKLSSKEKDALSKVKAALRPDLSASPASSSTGGIKASRKPAAPKQRPLHRGPSAGKRHLVRGKEKSQDDLEVIATHKVKKDETWTHLSLEYYGRTTEPFWRHIYEFNKDLIGDDYRKLIEGQEIKIPELTDELEAQK